MSPQSKNKEIVKSIIQVLTEMDMAPKPVERGSIKELRGGVVCIDLEETNEIDSLILLSKTNSLWEGVEYLYRIDYALRGGISGIPAGREIAKLKVGLVGFLRKRVDDVEWVVPQSRERRGDKYTKRTKGVPPKPGEVWENGPHQTLTQSLNNDRDLKEKIRNLLINKDEMRLEIFSDGWGESIRLTGGLWLDHPDFIETYISEEYIPISSRVFDNIKDVRRRFGGLAF